MKTNDLVTLLIIAIVGLICALILNKVIGSLINHRDRMSVKQLNEKLSDGRRQLIEARESLKRSIDYNDKKNESLRTELRDEVLSFVQSFALLKEELNNSISQKIFETLAIVDKSYRKPVKAQEEPLRFEKEPVQKPEPPKPEQKKKLFDGEFPKFVSDGLAILEKFPENPITNKIKDIVKKSSDPQTSEQWYEFYNKFNSREELLKIYKEINDKLRNDQKNPLLQMKNDILYRILKERE